MKTIGLIVAIKKEIEAVLANYGSPVAEENCGGFPISIYENPKFKLVVLHSGMGEIAAAGACQLLISVYHADIIANFGIVGGLTPEMAYAKTCIVRRAVHYDMDTSPIDPVKPGQYFFLPDVYIPLDEELFQKALSVNPELAPVTAASGDKFVAAPEAKAALHEAFDADICEMEVGAIALTCLRNKVPAISFKIVSDSINGGAEEFQNACITNADTCLNVLEQLV